MQQLAVPGEVSAQLLNHGGTYELVGVRHGGTSGSQICFYRNGDRLYALKYGPMSRVGVEKQTRNRALLEPYLEKRLPKIIGSCRYSGGEAMLMEAPSRLNLPDALLSGKISSEHALRISESIFREFRAMWMTSQGSMTFTRDQREKSQEVIRIADDNLTALGITPEDVISVNGRYVGRTSDLLPKLAQYDPPSFSVMCYLDLLPENFVLSEDGSEWYVVDWEWTGWHDWRVSAIRFSAWWRSNSSYLTSAPLVERTKAHEVNLLYDLRMPPSAYRMERFVRKQMEQVGVELNDLDWHDHVKTLIAYVRFGDLRFLKVRERQNLLIPLLGEGLSLLATRGVAS